MKKTTLFIFAMLLFIAGFSQEITLTFVGRDINTNAPVSLSEILIANETQGWTDTLMASDTVAVMEVALGIEENLNAGTFGLSQNNPNPFNGTTTVYLRTVKADPVALSVTDMNGKTVSTLQTASLQPGLHQFRIRVANAGTYVLVARQNGETSSIKMLSNSGTVSVIEYAGTASPSTDVVLKNGSRNHTCSLGDVLTFKGFADRYGVLIVGETVQITLNGSETIILPLEYVISSNPNDGQPCIGTPTVTDSDGIVYNTVELGSQCWLKENLKTTSAIGETYAPYGEVANIAAYGRLYTWEAAMQGASSSEANPSGVRGICPEGWHLPSVLEWEQLVGYVMCQSSFWCDEEPTSILKSLAAQTGWEESDVACSPGNDMSSNNLAGLSLIPAGDYMYGSYSSFQFRADYWTCTEEPYPTNYSYMRSGTAQIKTFAHLRCDQTNGISVRCLKD